MIENLQNSSKMLLAISNDSQQYDNFTTNFYPNYNGASQTYVQNYPSVQQNQSQYSYIQPNMRSVSQQNFPLLNVRTRRRRASHSVVATMDPAAVAKRNERERNRVKQVNDGFNELRQKIPYIPDKKKFSKVEILRFAMMYIRELQGVIGETSFDESKSETSASTNEYPGDESNMSDFQ